MFSTTFAVHDSCWTNLFFRLESFTKGQVVSEQYKTFDFPNFFFAMMTLKMLRGSGVHVRRRL
jgi:hypothetical protein